MGRAARRVPEGWEHPRRAGRYQPMFDESYQDALAERATALAGWPSDPSSKTYSFEEYYGEAPDPARYRPAWHEESRTHLMMYETTSEGTPISPAFETPEDLAWWLVNNGASAFAGMTADYEHWLRVCRGGFAPSAVIVGGTLVTGVEGMPAATTGGAKEETDGEA